MTPQFEHEGEVRQRREYASQQWVRFLMSQLASDDQRDVEPLRLQAEHAMVEVQNRKGLSKMAQFSSLSHALERLAENWFSEKGQLASHQTEILRDLSRQQAAQLVSCQ